jgi:hypothetical protein
VASADHSRPEQWLEELLEELRSEEVDAAFRQAGREVPLPVVLADRAALVALVEATDRLGRELPAAAALEAELRG